MLRCEGVGEDAMRRCSPDQSGCFGTRLHEKWSVIIAQNPRSVFDHSLYLALPLPSALASPEKDRARQRNYKGKSGADPRTQCRDKRRYYTAHLFEPSVAERVIKRWRRRLSSLGNNFGYTLRSVLCKTSYAFVYSNYNTTQ